MGSARRYLYPIWPTQPSQLVGYSRFLNRRKSRRAKNRLNSLASVALEEDQANTHIHGSYDLAFGSSVGPRNRRDSTVAHLPYSAVDECDERRIGSEL